jgi:hypothetical protein
VTEPNLKRKMIHTNSERLKECTVLSEEILKNIELTEIPMKNIMLKCLRLCRLLGDDTGIKLFTNETSGYPQDKDGYMTPEDWKISRVAGRIYTLKDNGNDDELSGERAFTESVAVLEQNIHTSMERMKVAKDPDSYGANITPLAITYAKNSNERNVLSQEIQKNTWRTQKVIGSIYDYILKIYNQLQYGNVIEDVFTQSRVIVDEKLTTICPEAIKKFVSVYNNMDSSNPEDWANAVHSCRRILKDVADALYPPCDIPIEVNGRKIKLDADSYINRLIQYINSKSESATFINVVGSSLSSIGIRLDSINEAVCKGTHTEIKKEEAHRYIIHTYLLLGDILSL